ncbi:MULTISPECIES: hypothetical protein [Gemmobacter]|jgi:hypothetical protein|uniref:17 kDa surface antigen n=2 Tax=Gemmobacter TaxID=204456 RepID=A0A2T6BC02_9RHOB|nr:MULTISPECIES: hypothetical protein [Gemmobacter]OJY27510.1 MAG: hypothetical protein BGP11_15750 [Rhodobacterales bacterium 65-51]PTX53593.1 hypothetical protein C8N34_101514 [Gemmobacter caeni]TWJ05704.1 hypothetical protein IQ03_00512 [Gemmobacter caeni]GHC14550.1 hypothetical protein GCM10007291_10260 [Gemmobacter nanjingensis]
MRITSLLASGALVLVVAGCVQSQPSNGYYGQPSNPLQTQGGRAVAGAVVGAAIADATDENMVAGAALGALAGGASCGVAGLPACY